MGEREGRKVREKGKENKERGEGERLSERILHHANVKNINQHTTSGSLYNTSTVF